MNRIARWGLALLLLATLACDDKPDAVPPPARSNASPSVPVRLSSDLRRFSAWSSADSTYSALAPYRLKGAFALGAIEPKQRNIAVHFSQSAANCQEFLETRKASRTLLIENPDHPKDPTSLSLEVQEADPERGVRANWSFRGGPANQVLPHGELSEIEQIWQGNFVAAGCGRVPDPEYHADETHARGGARVELALAGETVHLQSATLTNYYDPLVGSKGIGDAPLSPQKILAHPPKWRLLQLSADHQFCLSRSYFWHGAAGLRIDPSTNEVIDLYVSNEHHSLDIKSPKLKLVWNDRAEGEFVGFSIEAGGNQAGKAFSLSGTARAQRCN